MPACSVVVCKKTSNKVNYQRDGISFHTYPHDPNIKEKWINATGRGPNWFPTKNSTICSSHFEPKCFQPLVKVRRLFEWSVPTLKLHKIFTDCTEPQTSKISVDHKLDCSNSQIEAYEQTGNLEHLKDNKEDKNEINETPRERKMRRLICAQSNYIKKQKTQIKRLQMTTSRYRKKIADLKERLENLKQENYLAPIMLNNYKAIKLEVKDLDPTL